jgi:hypothetical protein
MNGTEAVQVRRKPHIVMRAIQWIVATIFALFALLIISDSGKLKVQDAPVELFWAALSLSLLLAVVHSPAIFFRLPSKARLLPYGATIIWAGVFGGYIGLAQAAYDRSPEGRREIAEQQARTIEAAKTTRVEQIRAAQEKAEQESLEKETQKDRLCEALVPQVTEMASGRGVNMIELNQIFARKDPDPDRPLDCFAEAITSSGQKSVRFGVSRSPQGKEILHLEMQD